MPTAVEMQGSGENGTAMRHLVLGQKTSACEHVVLETQPGNVVNLHLVQPDKSCSSLRCQRRKKKTTKNTFFFFPPSSQLFLTSWRRTGGEGKAGACLISTFDGAFTLLCLIEKC